jgi:hypothetical protein
MVTSGKKGITTTEIVIAVGLFTLSSLLVFSYVGLTDPSSPVNGIFGQIIPTIKIISTIISMIAIAIIVYSFIRIHEISSEQNKKLGLALNWESERTQKNERWVRIEEYMTSLNPSDWKVAILEADNMLDEITERMGYPGGTLGERMKNISASDFPHLEEAWEAHKIRNAVAHKGTDYALSRSDAEHVVNIYYRIFSALGYL